MKIPDHLSGILEEEDKNAKRALHEFQKELEHHERSFNLLLKTVFHICDLSRRKTFSSQKTAVMLVIPHIIQSLLSTRALTLKGYHYDTEIIERSLMESMGLCAYLALNEKEARKWLDGKRIDIAKIRLFDQIAKLFPQGEIDANFDSARMYGHLSTRVHTDLRAALSLVSFPKRPSMITMKFSPHYNKKRVDRIASVPAFMLLILSQIYRDDLSKKRQTEIAKFLREVF